MIKKAANILLPYENKWVALTPAGDEVIAYASDVKKLAERLEKLKVKHGEAVMTWVFPFKRSFAP